MNNNDLIDRDALIKAIGQNPESSGNQRAAQILECILNASLVDAVPVVWCGECKFYKPAKYAKKAGTCHKRSGVCKSDDFCSYGERKSDE